MAALVALLSRPDNFKIRLRIIRINNGRKFGLINFIKIYKKFGVEIIFSSA